MNIKKNFFSCEICNSIFYSKWGKKQTCSNDCLKKLKSTDEYKQNFLDKTRKTFLKRFGVDNPAKNDLIKKKTEQTCLKKYGAVSPTLNEEIRKKQIDTCQKKYGSNTPLENNDIFNKTKQSLKENYNTDITWKSHIIVKKSEKTKIKKYGNKNYNNIEKSKQTCLKKYGFENPMKSNDVKRIQRSKIKENYYEKIINSEKYFNLIPLFDKNKYLSDLDRKLLYKFKCKKCNTEFDSLIIHGLIPRCKTCYPPFTSKSQLEVYDYIKSIITPPTIIEQNYKKAINSLELDIYIPLLKFAIEFNGLFWHSEISGKKYKNYHINKTEKCKEEGIKLIHIFEDEWIEKQEIVKNKLKHILKLNTTTNKKIMGRKCQIKEISSKLSSEFLDKYHIQGKNNSNVKLGAFYNNELVSVMTFGKLRLALGNKNTKSDEYEMYRFCVGNKNVVGIAGKLFSYFIKTYKPHKIISYADKRWSNENAFYGNIGFKKISDGTPNYWYINSDYTHRYYRFNFRKQILHKILPNFDPSLTEWENMQLNGYDRIWDCGNLKYEWIK